MKKFKKIIFAVLVLSIVLLPMFSFAQTTPTTTQTTTKTLAQECSVKVENIGDVICRIGFYLNKIIPLLVTLGVLYFVWGIVTYMIGNDEEAKKKGKNKIIYGIIGLVVIVGMWGLVNVVVNTFDLDQSLPIENIQNITNITNQTSQTGSCFTTYQGNVKPKLGDLLNYATCLVGTSIVPLIFILAVVTFIWGVLQYVMNADSEEKRKKGRDFMIWGILALSVMVSIWGLVQIFGNTFNIDTGFVPQVKEK